MNLKQYYYNVDSDRIMSIDEIYNYYCEFSNDYETFSEYVNSCLYINNGSLKPLFESDYIS